MKKQSCCKNLKNSLSDYIDGTLDESFCVELERHLSECTNCRVVVNTLKKTVELYHQVPDQVEVPAGAKERLFRSLDLGDFIH
jgi:anti-sigma factor RsiW